MPCLTLGTVPLCFHSAPSKTRKPFILLSGTGFSHIFLARKNEEWMKLPSLDICFLNDFCGFFKTVGVLKRYEGGYNTFLTEYGWTKKFQEHGNNF
jgi:hypothetical protein